MTPIIEMSRHKKAVARAIVFVSVVLTLLLIWSHSGEREADHMDLNAYPLKKFDSPLATKSVEEIQYQLALRKPRDESQLKREEEIPKNPFGNISEYLDVGQVKKVRERDFGFSGRENDNFTPFPKLAGENVISMTLYGSDLRYTMGAIRNAELAKRNFPGWKLRVYTETPSEHPRYGIVPQTVLYQLRKLGADILFMDPGEDHVPPMMWRFLVGDDEWVDRFIVRDTDSRLTERDAAAVNAWVQSGAPFHSIRDHPSHTGYAISGGLWGAVSKPLRDLLRRSWRELMMGRHQDYLEDMAFLNAVIWPKVQHVAYCSDSVSCTQFPNSYPFPVQRYGYECVGAVYDEHDLARPIDIRILRQAGENPECFPNPHFHALNVTVFME